MHRLFALNHSILALSVFHVTDSPVQYKIVLPLKIRKGILEAFRVTFDNNIVSSILEVKGSGHTKFFMTGRQIGMRFSYDRSIIPGY